LRGLDLNQRPLGYEPNELPDCSTPHNHYKEGRYACQGYNMKKMYRNLKEAKKNPESSGSAGERSKFDKKIRSVSSGNVCKKMCEVVEFK
jgi:hypothetical protein